MNATKMVKKYYHFLNSLGGISMILIGLAFTLIQGWKEASVEFRLGWQQGDFFRYVLTTDQIIN